MENEESVSLLKVESWCRIIGTRLECEVSASLRKTCECQSEEYGLYPFGSAEPLNTFKQ